MKNKYQDNNYILVIYIPIIILMLIIAYLIVKEFKVDLRVFETILLFSSILFGMIYLKFRLYRVDENFLRNRQDLSDRLKKLNRWPRKWDQSFRQLPLMCYENTWLIAVTEFVKQSDVILMDLRGLSEEKSGCETEISYLLDVVPLNEIVFLTNQSDIVLVKQVIKKNWKALSLESPNLYTQNPKIKVFVASEESLEDVQGLMDLMLEIAEDSLDIAVSKV